jgi:hypothetical protein
VLGGKQVKNVKINLSRMSRVGTSLLAVIGALSLAPFAKASIVDTTNDVTYELTSTFTPRAGNIYDVFLAVDTSLFNQGPGFLTSVALHFNASPTSVTLEQAPGGLSDWGALVSGTVNSSGCHSSGAGFDCFPYIGTDSLTSVPHSSILVFEFAVTLPGSTALSTANGVDDIKAEYNTARDGSGTNLGITSQGITIDACVGSACGTIRNAPTTPEPGTMVMLISGLGLLGVGAFRKVRS